MERPDALFYSIAFYAYLAGFFLYIIHIASRKRVFGRTATVLMVLGIIPHTAAFFARWSEQGHIPLANMYEYMGTMSWMVVAALLYFIYRYRTLTVGVFIAPVAVLLLVVASLLPSEVNRQLMPALQSTWLTIHVIMAALGSGAFMVAFAASTLYLLAEPSAGGKRSGVQWGHFLLFWVAAPALTALLLGVLGLLPVPVNRLDPNLERLSGSAVTALTLHLGGGHAYWGRPLTGLGIGLILAAVLWPLALRRIKSRDGGNPDYGARHFAVHILGLLLAAVLVGFFVKGNVLTLTDRSYFKIFEFFGAMLVISWLTIPATHLLLTPGGGGWVAKLGLSRGAFEELSYAAVTVGYPLYTVGALFAGAIWAEQAWGSWWSWDPKEVGALIIWLFYTGFLHARYQRRWKGKPAAVLVILGMVMVFLSFFGNYFFGGLHSFEVG